MEMKPVAEFVGMMLHSATITHLMHLQTTGEGSFAAHSALGTYYDEIVDLTDAVAECIQGAYDVVIDGYPPAYADTTATPLEYMKTLRAYVRNKRSELPQDSEIQNEIDSIANLINRTCYKLERLR